MASTFLGGGYTAARETMTTATKAKWERRVGAWVTERFHAEMNEPDLKIGAQQKANSAWEESWHDELRAPRLPGDLSSRTILWAAMRAREALGRGEINQAARFTKQALQHDPQSPVAMRCMGYLRYRSGDFQAVGDFEASLHYGNRLWSQLQFSSHYASIIFIDKVISVRCEQNTNEGDVSLLSRYMANPINAGCGATKSVARTVTNLLLLQVSQRVTNRFMKEIGWPSRNFLGSDNYDPILVGKLDIWLKLLQDAIRQADERLKLSITTPLLRDHGLIRDGASARELEPGLRRDEVRAPARVAFLRGELAWRDGDVQRAKGFFDQVVTLAPHVTAGHRYLARIAEASEDYRAAARFYEAACAIPNQHWIAADTSDWMPVFLTRTGGRRDVYRFRGGLYAIERTDRFRGLTVVSDRLIEVNDTRLYLFWRQFGPKTRRLMGMLRRTLGKFCRASGLDAMISAVAVIPAVARFIAAAASILRRGKRDPSRPTGPGRLISVVLAIERRLHGTILGTPAKSFARWFIAHEVSGLVRAYTEKVKLLMIKVIFDIKEITVEDRAQTLEELILRLNRRMV